MMEDKLMAYIYGEMSAKERTAFEQWLQQHPEVQAEVDELQSTRGFLSELEDTRPEATVVEIRTAPTFSMRSLRWASAAAVVGLFMWVAQPRLHVTDSGTMLAFGGYEPPVAAEVVDYEGMIESAVLASNQQIYQDFEAMQTRFEAQLSVQEQDLLANYQTQLASFQTKQGQALAQLVKQEYKSNLPVLVTNIQRMQLDQQQELQSLVTELWYSWQEVRTDDLEIIEQSLAVLQEDVTRQQVATNTFLETLLTD